MSEAPDIDTGA